MFATSFNTAATSESSLLLYQKDAVQLNIARHPLLDRSVEIYLSDQSSLEHLNDSDFGRIWETRRLAEAHLSTSGNKNRLCYAKLEADKSPVWQITPYDSLPAYLDNPIFGKIYSIFKQAAVLFRTLFPAAEPSGEKLERVRTFWANLQPEQDISIEEKNGRGPLTEESVIERQIVYPASKDDHEILLLYNYAPLRTGEEQMHFLLTPSPANPAENFLELDSEQYIRVLTLSQRVAQWVKEEFGSGAVVYFFDKTGKIAGQTQPLYHAHLIIVNSRREEFWGRITLFFRMLVPARPLPSAELERRVFDYRKRLGIFLAQTDQWERSSQ